MATIYPRSPPVLDLGPDQTKGPLRERDASKPRRRPSLGPPSGDPGGSRVGTEQVFRLPPDHFRRSRRSPHNRYVRGRQTAASRAKAATLTTLKRDLSKERIGHLDRQKLIDYGKMRAEQGAGPVMREKGCSEEEIAAFFVSASVVKQRLKLAAVAPSLLDAYAEEEMTLDQLMAFTINPDHARQEQVWEALQRHYSKQPYEIRRMLTEGAVRASDNRPV